MNFKGALQRTRRSVLEIAQKATGLLSLLVVGVGQEREGEGN